MEPLYTRGSWLVLGNFRDQCVSQHSPSQHIRLCGVVRVSLSRTNSVDAAIGFLNQHGILRGGFTVQ
jgi:hypothetical protein